MLRQDQLQAQIRMIRAVPCQSLETPKDGASTASLDSLHPCLDVPSVKGSHLPSEPLFFQILPVVSSPPTMLCCKESGSCWKLLWDPTKAVSPPGWISPPPAAFLHRVSAPDLNTLGTLRSTAPAYQLLLPWGPKTGPNKWWLLRNWKPTKNAIIKAKD